MKVRDEPLDAGQDMPRGATSRETDALASLRRKCHNTLAMVTVVLMDSEVLRLLRGMLTLFAHVRLWHGLQAKAIRSAGAAAEWYAAQACGAGYEHLSSSYMQFSSVASYLA